MHQGAAASPGLEAFVKGSKNGLLIAGPIADGPGGAGNPLILRGHWAPVRLQNPHNSYRGPTVISAATLMEGSSNRHPTVRVAAQSRLGNGDLIVEPSSSFVKWVLLRLFRGVCPHVERLLFRLYRRSIVLAPACGDRSSRSSLRDRMGEAVQ